MSALVKRVKSIHLRVTGIAPDSRAHRTDDPDLLTWVHVAEVASASRRQVDRWGHVNTVPRRARTRVAAAKVD